MSNVKSQTNKKTAIFLKRSGFGERLRIIRGDRSRETFAQLLEVSASAINNYENEKRFPTVDFLYKLYILEGVLPNYLVAGYGKPYEEDAKREEVVPDLYHERTIINNVLSQHMLDLTDKQVDAMVEIIKEELERKIVGIAEAIVK